MSGSSTSRLIAAGLLLLYCAAGQEKAPLTVEICDLAQSPNEYAGKIVRVRGQVSSGWMKPGKAIKEFTIKQLFSSTRCLAQLPVVLPDRASPKPEFEVRRDEAYERFEKALGSSMTIEATFQGHLQATGRRNRSGSVPLRLVLSQIADVDAHVLFNK
jgi:hypothetical protein